VLETIRQYGEERLTETGETDRWQARHADYYVGVLQQIRHHDRREEVFWAVRLSAEQDNLLAAWAWTIDTRNIDTAFSILTGFAPSEIWNRYPLLLDGEAALELPGAAARPGYPLALAVSARFASHRADVSGTEELCRRAAEANERRDAQDWRVEEVICDARSYIAFTVGAFADAARLAERAAGLARAGGDLADTSLWLGVAAGGHLLVGDAPRGVPLAREALTLARQIGDPALIASGLLAVGATVVETDPEQARACLRESLELSTALGYQSRIDHIWAVGIAFLLNDRTATLELGRRGIRALQPAGDRLRMGFVLHMIAGALAATQPEAAAIIQGAAEAYVAESHRLDRHGGSGRGARARTPRPRRRHGLGPNRRLHPRSDHPSPQRTPIRNPTMSKSPGGHMPAAAIRPRRPAHVEGSSAPIGLSLAALDRRLGQIKCRLLLCSSADSATATRRRGRIDRHRYRGAHRPGGIAGPADFWQPRTYV
jgi:hypothetical protein